MFFAGLANNGNSNLCFLNSVLQALASVAELTVQLQQHPPEEDQPVIPALLELTAELNTPRRRRTVLRATRLVEALLASNPSAASLFNSRQQDAHEMLMLILDSVQTELLHHRRNSSPNHGLAALIASSNSPPPSPSSRSPFEGLMANRIACAACGFSAGIQHSPTDHLSITLPICPTVTLEDCLKEYTGLELLDDYACRKCTLLKTQREVKREMEESTSKRKRKELKARLVPISKAIQDRHFERELDPLVEHSLCTVWSPMSTKQIMFARPPRVLTVHISRSAVVAGGQLVKNACQLVFPELLILDPFTTTGSLCARAELPISGSSRATTTTTTTATNRGTSVAYPYRLLALVVHQGTHGSGHYLAFRRAPDASWWRLSDQDADPCPLAEVLHANPSLLIYQRLGDHLPESV
ncbi:hypothetical protein PCASD_20871 [Puccinia coronata f. sp. avenae]|uniref:ubiquitinyl hydrolase 1 n=1 Tax=Puccinia coronata f. sp. avenae TaxID=200324 RepID=A0A2N5TS38_9BASI|nr:hypothetical protein PCASD_20871 [Puccinia coronata f. sp. avenae]